MQMACGWLRWPPDAFWNATLADVNSAVTGYLETKVVSPPDSKAAMYDELLAVAKAARDAERAAREA